MAYDLYDSMILSLGDPDDKEASGPIAVEIAERFSNAETSIQLRIAFQEKGMENIEFRNKAQLMTVLKALFKFLEKDSVMASMLK